MEANIGPYELNRIYTGDARVLAEQIPDESVDLVLTDPPFGINYQYSNGYKDNPKEYPALVEWIINTSNRVIKPGGLCFVYVAQPKLRDVWPLFPDDSRIFAACKNFVQMRPTPVQFAYDPVIFWQKPGEYGKEEKGRDWHIGNTANTNNRKLNEAGFHSCPRPLDTITYMVENFCPAGGIVADFFAGSGTTALAAVVTWRNYIAFELDEDTAALASRRLKSTPVLSLIPQPEQLGLL